MRPKRPAIVLPRRDTREVRAWILGKPIEDATIFAKERGVQLDVHSDAFFVRFDGRVPGPWVVVRVDEQGRVSEILRHENT